MRQSDALLGCIGDGITSPRMSDFDTAESRLDAALSRLEAALAKTGGRPAKGAATVSAGDHTALRDECERLSKALSEAEADNKDLKKAATGLAAKLDSSIHELDVILED